MGLGLHIYIILSTMEITCGFLAICLPSFRVSFLKLLGGVRTRGSRYWARTEVEESKWRSEGVMELRSVGECESLPR